jgi:hypothetical protein
MEREKLESMMIDYVDGTLGEADRQWIQQEIATNPEAKTLFNQTRKLLETIDRVSALEPSVRLKNKFEKELQSAIAETSKGARVVPFSRPLLYRIAAGVALVMASGMLFYWINRSLEQERQLAILEKQMQETKTMMMALLDDQSSAGQRIQGVSVAYKMEKADDEIVNALIKTMNQDPNINVRLAALDALSKFHQQPHVRSALIKSLGTQTDPAVQIALIRLLVEIKETQTLKELQRIANDENVLPAVQDEAHAGILKLS